MLLCVHYAVCAHRYHLFHFWQNVFNDDIQVLDVAQQGECERLGIIRVIEQQQTDSCTVLCQREHRSA